MRALRIINQFTRKHPVVRGMVTYAVLWPCSNLCQQVIQGREKYDLGETVRFSVFGSVYVAPTIYLWVRFIGYAIPGQSIKHAVLKALIEQIMYSPIAISTFYLGMSLMERKTWADAKEELKNKFFPTYRTGFCVWPVVQTLNFAFVKERNRVSVTGTVSFFWTVFLSYMKQLEVKKSQLLTENTKNENVAKIRSSNKS